MKKIYLAPSNQTANKYSYGSTNEAVQCQAIADKVKALLASYDCECKIGAATETIQTKAANANKWGADVYLSIHSNAGGGRGTEVWYNPNKSGSKNFAQAIYNQIAKVSPGGDRGLKSSTAYLDVKCPDMACCLCEMEFHDWSTGAKWIVENKDAIAAAFVAGLVSYLGLKKKASPVVKPTTTTTTTTAPKAGDAVVLKAASLYSSATAKNASTKKTGTYYLWDGVKVSNRYRITNSKDRVGKAGQVTGWIDASVVVAGKAATTAVTASYKTYTVKKNDSWWSIAAKEMGSGLKCNELAKYNGKTILTIIHPGQTLKIPK